MSRTLTTTRPTDISIVPMLILKCSGYQTIDAKYTASAYGRGRSIASKEPTIATINVRVNM
jgi:hypothetical protein